ncbi:hypothetical protein [Moorena sp. SIO4G3]|uniref:hypothetical protein n=1 Tax=Moorena sp. SIO4G3 TaxID=2607821 RepID=UPI00142C92A2|nr:hypothetical protein [Moorena sp. SIO4G3]NEO77259.1 hypothetical protein [Moorena sp. SIO4G3]
MINLFPTPYLPFAFCLLPFASFLFPVPCSLFPTPYSPLPPTAENAYFPLHPLRQW